MPACLAHVAAPGVQAMAIDQVAPHRLVVEPGLGRIVALDEPTALKRQYQTGNDLPNLEEVFMAATGTSLEDADQDEDEAEAA